MKKYNLSQIMKKAWELFKKGIETVFSLALRRAWIEAKKLKWMDIQEKLEKYVRDNYENANGWYTNFYVSKWQKGNMDRTYITIKSFRNNKQRNELSCGYWDNVSKEYVAYNKYNEVLNVLTGEIY